MVCQLIKVNKTHHLRILMNLYLMIYLTATTCKAKFQNQILKECLLNLLMSVNELLVNIMAPHVLFG